MPGCGWPLLHAEEEIGRDQDRLQRELDALFVGIAAFGGAVIEREEAIDLGRL